MRRHYGCVTQVAPDLSRSAALSSNMRRSVALQARRKMMASIRGTNTKPEMIVRRMLWHLGVRYRLHARDLPGRPDIVMRGKKRVVFVHGCLWHLHEGCKLVRVPKTRPDYWPKKLAGNKERDRRNFETLQGLGWAVEIVWECETLDEAKLRERLRQAFAA